MSDDYCPGDFWAAPDPPDYPRHWGSDERATAYWEAVRTHASPRTTASWEGLLKQARQRVGRHRQPDPTDDEAPF